MAIESDPKKEADRQKNKAKDRMAVKAATGIYPEPLHPSDPKRKEGFTHKAGNKYYKLK